MTNDTLSDMIIRIKNGYLANNQTVDVPYSNMKLALARLLSKYGFIGDIKQDKNKQNFKINLIYEDKRPAMTDIKRISKPGLRKYMKLKELMDLKQGLGLLILSTPKGLMTHVDARKIKTGGEIVCKVW